MRRPDILLGDIHSNDEAAPNRYGTDAHDESFEGSTPLYAKHLIEDHGFTEADLGDLPSGSDQSSWSALNELHRRARLIPKNVTLPPTTPFWMSPRVTVHNNGESTPATFGPDAHDLEFEGDNNAFARHLIGGHGYRPSEVEVFRADGGPAGWHTMRNMHYAARTLPSQ